MGSEDALNPCVGSRRSDRSGEFGERGGDPQRRQSVDGEFVVSAAEVLHEGLPGDEDLCGRVRS